MTEETEGYDYRLLDFVPIGAFALDRHFRVLFWNTQLEDWSGIKRDEILNTLITDRFPHLKETRYYARIDNIFKGAPPTVFSSLLHKYIIPIKTDDGRYRVQHTFLTPVPGRAEGVDALFIIQDVTDLDFRINAYKDTRKQLMQEVEERKRAEESMREAKMRAEEATRLKDKFVSLVSHDLKGPLGNVMGLLEMIQDEQELNADGAKLLGIARNSADHMLQIIDDILSVSRFQVGGDKKQRFLDAVTVVRRAISNLEDNATRKGIKIVNDLPEKMRVFADVSLLSTVIQNLLTNAIKFTSQGDTITIYQPEDRPHTIAVKDTGIGIDPERQEGLFHYESKSSTMGTAKERGTGFGLPLSREMMESMGGSLTISSQPGKGSTFFAALPSVSPRALVVDDDPPTRKLVERYLEKIEVASVSAESGEQALEKIREEKFDLVITDLTLPGMGGFALLEKLKSDPVYKAVPVLLITADLDMDTRDQALKHGADDFAGKPIKPQDFLPRVRRFLG